MRLTAEVRWTCLEPIPDDVHAWFESLGDQPSIEKHRRTRAFVRKRNTPGQATPETASSEGGNLERPRRIVQGKEYGSIGFEGFDDEATRDNTEHLVDMLRLSIALTMRRGPLRSLLTVASDSYADWLREAVYEAPYCPRLEWRGRAYARSPALPESPTNISTR